MPTTANIERLPAIQRGELVIDPQCYTAILAGEEIHLFPKEFDTLYLLVQYPNWVLTIEQIYQHIWKDEPVDCDHIVRNIICQLRRKLGNPKMIQTVVGHGYKFVG